jgi:hypothetical protein
LAPGVVEHIAAVLAIEAITGRRMLSNDCDIHIIHATTGELICQLILNPAIDYQARGVLTFQ